MSGGVLDFSLPRPDWLNFGRTAVFDHELTLVAVLPLPLGFLQFSVSNPIESSSGLRWQTAYPHRTERSVSQPSASLETQTVTVSARAGQPMALRFVAPWAASDLWAVALRTPWAAAQPCSQFDAIPWTAGQETTLTNGLLWEQGQPVAPTIGVRFATGNPAEHLDSLRFATARPTPSATERIRWQSGLPYDHADHLLYQQAMPPPRGWRIAPYIRPATEKHEGRLNFVCPYPHTLNFGLQCLGSALLYPALRRSYRVINTASLIRVSDEADLPCSAISVGLDWASWSWSLSATLIGRAAHDLVPGYPGKVRATLNGFSWDFIVDDLSYSRKFGEFSATISGRSPAAVMAEPYAATRSTTETNLATAQQLALQELISGWQLDWAETLVDWTVPARTYEYSNLSPIASIIRIIKAAGGRVYADPTENVLHAVPKWPVAPWNWSAAVPDQSLPSSYTLTEQRKVETGAEYDCIVVSGGVNNGVCVLATRTGMPGTYPANAQVDSLITDLAPATARATQELADSWPMKHYQLSLPLQATPAGAGLLLPGMIIDFVDGDDGWRGLVTGVKLSAGRDSIQQDLEIISP